jgi:hypothetical protein
MGVGVMVGVSEGGAFVKVGVNVKGGSGVDATTSAVGDDGRVMVDVKVGGRLKVGSLVSVSNNRNGVEMFADADVFSMTVILGVGEVVSRLQPQRIIINKVMA